MKREFLKELGIEDDVIDKIMTEHGKGITKAKNDHEDLKEQLTTATATIEDLKKNNKDNETLQATITSHEATIQKLQDEAVTKDFNYRLENVLKGEKVKNIKALKALLKLDDVKLEGDELKGLKEQLTALKESDAYLFDVAEPNLGGASPTNNHKPPKEMSKERFVKMSYKERVELFNTNPDLYNQLSN